MSSWFDIDAIADSIKSSVDEASKLVADMNLDNMQELQEREENDPEFAAHNAAVRRHQQLMAELQAQEKRQREDEKRQEFFSPATLWDEPIMYSEAVESGDDISEEDEEGVDSVQKDVEFELARDRDPDEIYEVAPCPEESVLASLTESITMSELPAMPKISFSLKQTSKAVDNADAVEIDVVSAESNGAINAPPEESVVLPPRTVVARESSRLWAMLGKTNPTDFHSGDSVALSGCKAKREPQPLFFDNVDEEVDLESDPILKQVAHNRANPGVVPQGMNTMKDIMAKIMKPFEEMSANRSKNHDRVSSGSVGRMTDLSPHYGDLPLYSSEPSQAYGVATAAKSLVANCVVIVNYIIGALLWIFGYIFPFLKNLCTHASVMCGRLSAACSSRDRNGDVIPIGGRINNVGWCVWTNISSRNGLGII